MNNEICRTCIHCDQSAGDVTSGECHVNPPKVFLVPMQGPLGQVKAQKVSGYPPVKLDDMGCGKHSSLLGETNA